MTDDELEKRRTEAVQAILSSEARLKLIVAGPGTGKTYAFQQLLGQTSGRSLAMTFLLSLVHDLESKFDDSVDVYSFHGFAKRLLHQVNVNGVTRSVEYYPPLSGLVVDDIRIVLGIMIDPHQLGGLFRELADDDLLLRAALAAGTYYNAVSHDDSVYRVLRQLERQPEIIPSYAQLVVDEYQDFCPMEVAFIEALSTASPTLIVGDDDQALYAFRNATPQAIRNLASGDRYTRFELPFCTRCTEVLVRATHTVVTKAQEAGRLVGRIDKRYECFVPEKRAESVQYPHIGNFHCSTHTTASPYVAFIVEYLIRQISPEEIAESHRKGFPTVLVIGPKPFPDQVYKHLKSRFANVSMPTRPVVEVDVLDGYLLIIRNEDSNLGWRILLQVLQPEGWETIVREAREGDESMRANLPATFVQEQLRVVALLERYKRGTALAQVELGILAHALGVEIVALDERISGDESPGLQALNEEEPTVLVTSLMGSKGLQAGHVFIVGLNDQHFPISNAEPTNEEICQLLVALTRARKKCSVVSTARLGDQTPRRSVFKNWLSPHMSPEVYVNKQYLEDHGLI